MLKELAIICAVIITVTGYEEDYEHHPPQPYHFGYEIKGEHGSQFQREKSDGHGRVEGSYGYTDEKGIYREVHYVADEKGFRAHVKTNEPGTISQDAADVKLDSSAKIEEEFEGFDGFDGGHAVELEYDGNEYRRSDNNGYIIQKQGEHGGHE